MKLCFQIFVGTLYNTVCKRAAKTLVSMCLCAGTAETLLHDNRMRTKISCASPNVKYWDRNSRAGRILA